MLLQRKSLGFVAPSGVKYLSFMLLKVRKCHCCFTSQKLSKFSKTCFTTQLPHRSCQLPLRVGTDEVTPASVVRDLGIYIDSDVSNLDEVIRYTQTVSIPASPYCVSCEASAGPFLSVLQSLVTSLVLTRLDHGNATLAGIPMYLLKRLQSVMNSASRCLSATAELLVLPTYYDETNCIGPV